MDALRTLDYLCCNRYSFFTSLTYNSKYPSLNFEALGVSEAQETARSAYVFVQYPGRPMVVAAHNCVGRPV